MGMAAGQARLLSITSRMSDNELRAQIINNNKMRLATESSQVSEAYVNALNQAQMMFTNYDADNNTSYQQLTFNSLTSYNPYNNQYGLVNASGQILVSETDATNFMNANGDMEKFLSFYNLEQKTTYFEELEKYQGTATDAITGKTINNVPVMYTDTTTGEVGYTDSGYTWDQLEILFNGGVDKNGVKHSGYDTALYSAVYNNYVSYAEKFDTAYTTFTETIATSMGEFLNTITTGGGLNSIRAGIDGTTDIGSLQTHLTNLSAFIGTVASYKNTTSEADQYFTSLKKMVNDLASGWSSYTIGSSADGTIKYDSTNNTVTIGEKWRIKKSYDPSTMSDIYTVFTLSEETQKNADGSIKEENGVPITTIKETEIGQVSGSANAIYYKQDDTGTVLVATDKDDASGYLELTTAVKDLFNDNANATATGKQKISAEEMQTTAQDIIEELQIAIYTYWDTTRPEFTKDKDGNETAAHLNFRQAAAEFLVSILNEGTDSDDYSVGSMSSSSAEANAQGNFQSIIIKKGSETYYIDLNTVLAMATDQESLDSIITSGLPAKQGSVSGTDVTIQFDQEEMQDLLDVIVLNNVMNTYGEPKIAWVDTKNPDENGEAKYKWYSNLFTRMQNGFAVLQDGLASSNEWIQFALENGIVTMEQVDSEDNWNSMNYTNCSDITEQTNDKAVAIAEAEYNAAMNKIENKDKRYDLELKNIDTEHNSLQTEYDSIKTAIDKNIERTFKIYS